MLMTWWCVCWHWWIFNNYHNILIVHYFFLNELISMSIYFNYRELYMVSSSISIDEKKQSNQMPSCLRVSFSQLDFFPFEPIQSIVERYWQCQKCHHLIKVISNRPLQHTNFLSTRFVRAFTTTTSPLTYPQKNL